MLEIAAALLCVAALAAGLRWWRRRDAALHVGRVAPAFPMITVSVLFALAGVALLPGVVRHHEERQLAAVAGKLVGAKVTVHCQSYGQSFVDAGAELGYVKFSADGVPEHATLIKREQCQLLKKYMKNHGEHPSLDEIVAVHVLTHESMHMRGETQESVTECEAVQRDDTTAALLGASPSAARQVAVTYWRDVYPEMPSDYVTPDCKPGGHLDEGLPTSPWNLLTAH